VRQARKADEGHNETGFTIKVGINSGLASVGNVGSGKHFSYTIMGKDVNLASRLESVPPLYGCDIVIGENTANLVRSKFLLRELDWIMVKGADKPMAIYQPIVDLNQATEEQKLLTVQYAEGLQYYREGQLTEAISIWEELVEKHEPAPSPSSVMAARAKDLHAKTIPPVWDAVNVLLTK
jgi:adenylate cyclase